MNAEDDAQICEARRQWAEAHPIPHDVYVCRCDHDHPPGTHWCYVCDYPLPDLPPH